MEPLTTEQVVSVVQHILQVAILTIIVYLLIDTAKKIAGETIRCWITGHNWKFLATGDNTKDKEVTNYYHCTQCVKTLNIVFHNFKKVPHNAEND